MKKIIINTKSMPYGFMIWWNKIEDTARYFIHLELGISEDKTHPVNHIVRTIINYQDLKCIEIDRNTFSIHLKI